MKVVSLEIVLPYINEIIPATFPFSSVFHVELEECWLAFVVFVVLFRLLIQIVFSISGTGEGVLETDQGWRVPVNAPESPHPRGKRSDRRAPGARKHYHDDERAACPVVYFCTSSHRRRKTVR